MKLVTFHTGDGNCRPGVLDADGVIDLLATEPALPKTVRGILAVDALDRVRAHVNAKSAIRVAAPILKSPIVDPTKIIGIGLNYRDHAIESGMEIPTEPIVFAKLASALIGPDEAIQLPASSSQVDYESELVVVIGKAAKNVSTADALRYVAGYTVGNDVSARDWQLKKPGGQWLLGKSFDTFAAVGPALVTADEVPSPWSLAIKLRLNGQVMQDSNTRQLIFGIPQLIAYLSQVCVLQPGDLIFTGTPPGVGMARRPPIFLQPGDVCEAEVEGLGVLRNACLAGNRVVPA
jgi:2-keto-4-pentenoate hydratase/2-oxohepta-3-ene-1,7-dioic acid hydratase in catechol pathway